MTFFESTFFIYVCLLGAILTNSLGVGYIADSSERRLRFWTSPSLLCTYSASLFGLCGFGMYLRGESWVIVISVAIAGAWNLWIGGVEG